MQNVSFPYEILVHDDASPDGTADIIREYEAKYPGIIKPIYQTENQYSQGKSAIKYNLDRACGKYLAFCEGDDYWINPGKLQKQMDFLETHPEYIACVHRVQVVDELGNPNQLNEFARCYSTSDFTLSDAENLIVSNGCAGHISSLVCHNIFLNLSRECYKLFINCKANGDTKLFLLLTLNGTIKCFDDTMSTYRYIVSGGTSYSARHAKKNTLYLTIFKLNELSHFSQRYKSLVPNYTEFKCYITILSILTYIKCPNDINKVVMNECLSENGKFIELSKHLIIHYKIYLKIIFYFIKKSFFKF